MTRETKIGLLVGLAFIIVVAILLTDHTTSTTAPRSAALPDAAGNVRESVATPAAATPVTPIPTRADMPAPRPHAENRRPPRIEVGPGGSGPIAMAGTDAVGGDSVQPLPGGISVAPGNRPGGSRGPGDLVEQHPQDFVSVGEPVRNGMGAAGAGTPPSGRRAAELPVTAFKTYVAEPGDSVIRIAQRQMGGNTKANREALIKANPSLQSEGNIVHVGKSYIIPSPGATQQAGEQPRTPAVQPFAPAPPPAAAAAQPFNWYTVKENDTLWRIAARELGDSRQWTVIRDINKDVLKGGEIVHPQMRIRLPKQATASTN